MTSQSTTAQICEYVRLLSEEQASYFFSMSSYQQGLVLRAAAAAAESAPDPSVYTSSAVVV